MFVIEVYITCVEIRIVRNVVVKKTNTYVGRQEQSL